MYFPWSSIIGEIPCNLKYLMSFILIILRIRAVRPIQGCRWWQQTDLYCTTNRIFKYLLNLLEPSSGIRCEWLTTAVASASKKQQFNTLRSASNNLLLFIWSYLFCLCRKKLFDFAWAATNILNDVVQQLGHNFKTQHKTNFQWFINNRRWLTN